MSSLLLGHRQSVQKSCIHPLYINPEAPSKRGFPKHGMDLVVSEDVFGMFNITISFMGN